MVQRRLVSVEHSQLVRLEPEPRLARDAEVKVGRDVGQCKARPLKIWLTSALAGGSHPPTATEVLERGPDRVCRTVDEAESENARRILSAMILAFGQHGSQDTRRLVLVCQNQEPSFERRRQRKPQDGGPEGLRGVRLGLGRIVELWVGLARMDEEEELLEGWTKLVEVNDVEALTRSLARAADPGHVLEDARGSLEVEPAKAEAVARREPDDDVVRRVFEGRMCRIDLFWCGLLLARSSLLES